MFAFMLMFNRHFQMQLFCWRFRDKIMCFASILRYSYFWIKPRLILSFYLCFRLTSPNYAFMRRRPYSKRKVKEYLITFCIHMHVNIYPNYWHAKPSVFDGRELLIISRAGCGQLVKSSLLLNLMGHLDQFFLKMLIYFKIVQSLVCKMVTRVCPASFWPVKVF